MKVCLLFIIIFITTLNTKAASVHFVFDEVTSGSWNVYATVAGEDTLGLAQYSIWVHTDPLSVSYTENILGTVNSDFAPVGFRFLASGAVGGRFNAGNFQIPGSLAIVGIGKMLVDEPGGVPGSTPHVQLGTPALLGTLSTPALLSTGDFDVTSANLLNAANDGVLSPPPTFEVNVIPEPGVGMVVMIVGGMWFVVRRRSRMASMSYR